MYLIVDKKSKIGAAVDPYDAERMCAEAERRGVSIESILTTHSHHDHDGGNANMKTILGTTLKTVYGGKGDGAAECTKEVTEGDRIRVGDQTILSVLSTPCHTRGHVCFVLHDKEGKRPVAVFTGDTLFVGGCGNFNSGTPKMMADAFRKLGTLPKTTLCFVGMFFSRSSPTLPSRARSYRLTRHRPPTPQTRTRLHVQ